MKSMFKFSFIFVFVLGSLLFLNQNVRAADPEIEEIWTSSGDDQSYISYGSAVASAGDLNGDGYADVMVSTQYFDTYTGKVFVYNGSANGVSATPNWFSTGENIMNSSFGVDMDCVGDVNGDGYDDVVIGANGYDSTADNNVGKAYVYMGSSSGLSSSPAWTSIGDNKDGARFGAAVSSAGDVNGDGYSDVVVGASQYDTTNSDAGKAFMFLGSASGLSTTGSWASSGDDVTDAEFGSGLTWADINGDGYDDVIVAAEGFETGAGKVFAYLGSATGLGTSASWYTVGDSTIYSSLGESLSSAGDINADGYDDIIIGAPYYPSTGKAYLYMGNSTGTNLNLGWSSVGEGQMSQDFGDAVAGGGDINGDGYDDLIISSSLFTPCGGKAYAYLGSSAGLVTTPVWSSCGDNQDGAYYGWAASMLGDVNGNGYNDFVVSALDFNTATSTNAGKAYVYSNQKDILDNEEIVLRDELVGKTFVGKGLVIKFVKLPSKLTKDRYWMKWKRFGKYPKKWKTKKKTSMKKYWRLITNLRRYKAKKKSNKFKIQVAFKYSKKQLRKLKKRNSLVKKKKLYLKYKTKKGKKWKLLTKYWKKAKIKNKKKKRRFQVKYFKKFGKKKYFYAIGLK